MPSKRKAGSCIKRRDPYWKWLRAVGHKVVRDRTSYNRKLKHKEKSDDL